MWFISIRKSALYSTTSDTGVMIRPPICFWRSAARQRISLRESSLESQTKSSYPFLSSVSSIARMISV